MSTREARIEPVGETWLPLALKWPPLAAFSSSFAVVAGGRKECSYKRVLVKTRRVQCEATSCLGGESARARGP